MLTRQKGCSVPESAVPTRAMRLGVAGPVGTGKSSLIAMICRQLSDSLSLAVVTNDIYTDEDARFLKAAGVLDPERTRSASGRWRPEPARIPPSAMTSR